MTTQQEHGGGNGDPKDASSKDRPWIPNHRVFKVVHLNEDRLPVEDVVTAHMVNLVRGGYATFLDYTFVPEMTQTILLVHTIFSGIIEVREVTNPTATGTVQ